MEKLKVPVLIDRNEFSTVFTIENPETGDKVYVPISNEDLLNMTREEIVQSISTIIEQTLNKKK